MAMPTAVAWLILVAILAQGVQSEVEDLCNVNGCSCNEDLTDVNCQCSPGQVQYISTHSNTFWAEFQKYPTLGENAPF